MPATNLLMALRALSANRLQALLTLCGMSVGIAMVVVVSGLGKGAQLRIEAQIEGAGPTLITIKAGNYRPAAIAGNGQQDSSGGEPPEGIMGSEDTWFGQDDDAGVAAALDARTRSRTIRQDKYRTPATSLDEAALQLMMHGIENVRAVAATLSGNVSLTDTGRLPVRTVRIAGFLPQWPDLRGWQVLRGQLPTAREQAGSTPLAVVSEAAAQRLWGESFTPGAVLNVGNLALEVIGVIRDPAGDGSSEVVPTVHVPMALARTLLGSGHYDQIFVRSRSVAHTTQVAQDIRNALRDLHQLPEDTLDDFRIETQGIAAMPGQGMDPRLARAVHSNVVEFEQASWEEMARSLRQAGRTFSLLLAAAASVSLLVGGIGVMNIMLVSVAARTREIGLRMALGARMHDVLLQFLAESVLLAALGGLLGLVLGSLMLWLARYSLDWATVLSPTMLLLAVVMAAITGAVFGFGPARRAAGLDPVVALKAE